MSSPKKTLIILTPGFPKSETDSTCLPMQQSLVKALKQNYPLVDIVVLTFQYPYHNQTYNWQDITVISFGGKNKGGIKKLLLRYKLNNTLKNIHSNSHIIGLLSFWYGECAWVGKNFADKYNLKHYCWILGQDAKRSNKYIKYAGLKEHELIAISDFIQQEFKKNYGIQPQHIIPAGIDTKQFDDAVKEKDIDIIAAGSLIPLKRYEILLNIIAAIKKQRPGITAVLIGNGPENNKLKKYIETEGLQNNITLTGELPYNQVLQWMQRGKIFLHPSSYEGFSGVCTEALYAGCNVISFCQPMKQPVEHWHIVTTEKEMEQKALQILQSPPAVYSRIIFLTVDDIAKKMMQLFPS